ncbi:MAG: hypothetical protein WA102_08850 [Candidatus Methanoperedens sp.]
MLKIILFGLITALLILVILIWKRFRGEWIKGGLLIGIISIFIDWLISPLLERLIRLFSRESGLAQIIAMLLIFVVLSIIYTYLKKESGAFFVKTLAVSFLGAALFLSVVWLFIMIGWFLGSEGAGGLVLN